MAFVYASKKPSHVIAFQYEENDSSYMTYATVAVVQYYSQGPGLPPLFKIGPSQTLTEATPGNYYFSPNGAEDDPRYLLEFTPEEWAEQFIEVEWDGATVPGSIIITP